MLGKPIGHSLSPALHEAAYRHLGLEWQYGRYEVDEAGLPAFLAGLDQTWRGLSLTMPLKEAALSCLAEVSPIAKLVSAVNTVLLEPDGHRLGDNTDVAGMVAALREAGIERVPQAAVLGGGATARSAVAALREVADRVDVYIRDPARGATLLAVAQQLDLPCEIRPWTERQECLAAPLVVATTPAHAADDLAAAAMTWTVGVLLDVVYDPWPTGLAGAVAAAGGTVVGGLDLLIHQAARQVELMTGRMVPVDVLRRAAQHALVARDGPVAG